MKIAIYKKRKLNRLMAFIVAVSILLMQPGVASYCVKAEELYTDASGLQYLLEENGCAKVVAVDEEQGALTYEIPAAIDVDEKRYRVNEIGANAFQNVDISHISLPTTVKMIGASAFEGSSIESINLSYVKTVGLGAFKNCGNLVSIKWNTIDSDCSYANAFDGTTNLQMVVIPDNISVNESNFLFQNSGVKCILYPASCECIGANAFANSATLEKVSMPEGVTVLKSGAFQGCNALNTIYIPDSVRTIEADVLKGNETITTIYGKEDSYAQEWADAHGFTFVSHTHSLKNGIYYSDTSGQCAGDVCEDCQIVKDSSVIKPVGSEYIIDNPGEPYPIPTTIIGWNSKYTTKGESVMWVQQFINEYYGRVSGDQELVVDGAYGQASDFQVRRFQKDMGVTSDGVAGPTTIGLMLQKWRELVAEDSETDTIKPVIKTATVIHKDSKRYIVSCEVSDNVGIEKVVYETWNKIAGTDEVQLKTAERKGLTATKQIDVEEFSITSGTFVTRIVAYDYAGNCSSRKIEVEIAEEGTAYKSAEDASNGHRYELYTELLSFNKAKEFALAKGGYLATIGSSSENSLIASLISQGYEKQCYVGGKTNASGDWNWENEEIFEYSNWDESSVGEGALLLDDAGNWSVMDASQKHGFIVEYDPEPEETTTEATTEEITTTEATTTEEITTTEVTTTEKITTTEEPTTQKITTTEEPTTQKVTTTQEPTTQKVTTTQEPTTQKVTTTQEPTTQKVTTTQELTTQKVTTTEEPTTQKVTTTEEPTTQKITTTQELTTQKVTTTEEPTTQKITATEEPTTQKVTTTEKPTTQKVTTTEKPTTQIYSTTEKSEMITTSTENVTRADEAMNNQDVKVSLTIQRDKWVKLTWNARVENSSEYKYDIYRSTKKNTGYKRIASTRKLSYIDKKVGLYKTYYYKIIVKRDGVVIDEYTTKSMKITVSDLTEPILVVKKGVSETGIHYLDIKYKKLKGTNLELYVKKGKKGTYKKVALAKTKIEDVRNGMKIRYLTGKTKLYLKIRTYKKVGKKKYYSPFSKEKRV